MALLTVLVFTCSSPSVLASAQVCCADLLRCLLNCHLFLRSIGYSCRDSCFQFSLSQGLRFSYAYMWVLQRRLWSSLLLSCFFQVWLPFGSYRCRSPVVSAWLSFLFFFFFFFFFTSCISLMRLSFLSFFPFGFIRCCFGASNDFI